MLVAEQTTPGPQASQCETLTWRLDNGKDSPRPSGTPGHTFEALGEERSQERRESLIEKVQDWSKA